MSQIDRLTLEQTNRLSEYAARWTAIGLSTEPADRPRAEAGIRLAYKIAGLPPPPIVWCLSPMGNALTRAIMHSVVDNVRASVRASVRDSVVDNVRASVWASVGDSVWASVRASVRDSVVASVRASVRDSVVASVRASVWASVYGQHDAPWLAFYAFFREVCGLTVQTEKLTGLSEVAQSAGWWLPHKHVCWVSERPSVLHRDEQGRLHCSSGPALSYPDGWSIYAWHGVRLPEWIITRPVAELSKADVLAVANAEQQRALIERLGDEAFAAICEPRTIHQDEHLARVPDLGGWANGQLTARSVLERRRLIEIDIPHDPEQKYRAVEVTCPSTGRRYLLRVPPSIATCQEGVAWTYDTPATAYAPFYES